MEKSHARGIIGTIIFLCNLYKGCGIGKTYATQALKSEMSNRCRV